MSPDRWQQVQALFEQALNEPPAARAAFLAAACADDDDLRREVASLLEAHDASGAVDVVQEALYGAGDEEAARGLASLVGEAPSRSGQVVGAYRIVRKLGEGGMGAVFLAEREGAGFEQRVALKLIRPGVITDEGRARFLNERQILARLQHDGIARLIDGGLTADGAPYFAMEYVVGEPITDVCERRGLSVDERLLLFTDVCAAVHYAHQHLVVHRDLKPSNILVAEGAGGSASQARVKLLDFGIAKLLADEAGLPAEVRTRTGRALMTPAYASPEQVRGDALTTASDLYALGVVLYELIAGRRPYDLAGRSPAEVERIVCEEVPPPPTAIAGAKRFGRTDGRTRRLAADLDVIVGKALAKEPERRYASAEALADDVRRYLAGFTIDARPDTLAYRLATFVRRHRFGVAATALLLLSLVGGAAATAWQARRATQGWAQARQEAATNAEVTRFLAGLFEAADPLQALGDTLTAFDMLDQGAARIDAELADRPLVQAEMLDVIGQVYLNLGRTDDAEDAHRRALGLRSRSPEASPLDVAESRQHLADALYDQGRYAAADSLYRLALATQRTHLGDEHVAVAQTLSDLGHVHLRMGDYAAAEDLLQRALVLRRRLLGPEHDEVISSLNSLGMVLYYAGDASAARPHLEEALALRERRLPPDHPDRTSSLNNLAAVLDELGDLATAERYYREAHDIRTRVLGEAHPRTMTTLNNVAFVLYRQGKHTEALQMYERALEVTRTTYSDAHPRVALLYNNIGRVHHAQGDYERALTVYRSALDLRIRLFGRQHPDVALSLHNLAGVYHERGDQHGRRDDLGRAADLYRAAVEQRRALLPPGHPDLALSLSHLGDCLTKLGRHAEAEPLLLEAHGSLAQKRSRDDGRRRLNVERLVALYDAWARPEEAAQYRALLAASGAEPG